MTTFKPTMTPEEEAEWAEKVQTGALFPDSWPKFRHGTGYAYSAHGCRCEECSAARSIQNKAYYQRMKARR